MNTIGDRRIAAFVSRLAERARQETLPDPETSAQVIARIRENKATVKQMKDDQGATPSCDHVDFSAVLAAKLRKHSSQT